jgi:L-aminopeptidase/D-esterase-like protein
MSLGSAAAGLGWPVSPTDPAARVPIVPTAILFDLGRGGAWLHHPTPADGAAAYRAATDGPVVQGCVGAGTGAVAGGLKGGIGSASCVLDGGITVGAIVAVNAMGSALDRLTGDLLGRSRGLVDEFAQAPSPDPEAARAYWAQRDAVAVATRGTATTGTATTIGVVATDATLTKTQCRKLAQVSHDGLARALAPVHTAYDGDTVFTLATGRRSLDHPLDEVDLQSAAADCVSRAIVHAMLAATSIDRTADGGLLAPAWSDRSRTGTHPHL